jgi:hypothetical protein
MSENQHPQLSPLQTATLPVKQQQLTWLIVAAVVTVILWQIPGGDYLLYPFTILATWFHEMGHGLMALLLGGQFHKLEIFGDGSGFAIFALGTTLGPIGPSLVAASGPMGPPIAGAAMILASNSLKTTSLSLQILGSFLLLSTLIWVRSWFGLLVIPLLGLMILAVAFKSPRWVKEFAIQFLGVQACLSTYCQLDYLFTEYAGPLGISDTGQIQRYLLLPYWFWGILMAIASGAILVQSLRVTYRST